MDFENFDDNDDYLPMDDEESDEHDNVFDPGPTPSSHIQDTYLNDDHDGLEINLNQKQQIQRTDIFVWRNL